MRHTMSRISRRLNRGSSCDDSDYILIDGDCGKMMRKRESPQDPDSIDEDEEDQKKNGGSCSRR